MDGKKGNYNSKKHVKFEEAYLQEQLLIGYMFIPHLSQALSRVTLVFHLGCGPSLQTL